MRPLYLRILYVDSDMRTQQLVRNAIRKAHPGHEFFASSSLSLAKSRLSSQGPFDYVIITDNVDDPGSGDGILFAIALNETGQKVIVLTLNDRGIQGIPTVDLNSDLWLQSIVDLLR